MKLYILFAQRRCSYPGEYAPEALEVCSEFDYDENPDWLDNKLAKARADSDFVAAEVIHINLDDNAMKAVEDRLNGTTVVEGAVTP